MKHKIPAAALGCIILIVSFTGTCGAVTQEDIRKAKEFMATGVYTDAAAILIQVVKERPSDADSLYQLGICYLQTGDYKEAQTQFDAAIKLMPDYAPKVGREFKQAGIDALVEGNSNRARILFEHAVKYQADLKGGIAQALMDRGAYEQAAAIDASRRPNAAEHLYKQSQKADGKEKISLLIKAIDYGGDYYAKLAEPLAEFTANSDDRNSVQYVQDMTKHIQREKLIGHEAAHFPRRFSGYGATQEIKLEDGEWHKFSENVYPGDTLHWIAKDAFEAKSEVALFDLSATIPFYPKQLALVSDNVGSKFSAFWVKKSKTSQTIYCWIERGEAHKSGQ